MTWTTDDVIVVAWLALVVGAWLGWILHGIAGRVDRGRK